MEAGLFSSVGELRNDSVPVEHVCFRESEWRESDFSDRFFLKENIFCPPNIQNSVLKRRCEYFYGRLSARAAIRQFLPEFDGVIGSSEDRSPIWPPGIVGSISHCKNYAISVCGEREKILTMGIDAEPVISDIVADDIAPSIIADKELEFKSVCHWPFGKKLTLAFSAKESLYKAFYPLEKRFFSFDSAEIIDIDPPESSFSVRLTERLGTKWKKGSVVNGRFTTRANPGSEDIIVTTIIIPA